jgi:predicted nucleotide-binding protein (sugar kinase/HSP70/actin superfamily)
MTASPIQPTRPGQPWPGYPNPPWRSADRDKVTILFNFVERRKSFFLKAYFDRMGYRSEDLGDYVYEDVRWGKEYGNRMECNPMYFTIGCLLKNLFRIQRETGLTKAQIVERYVFVCGGGQCGPCRYGMYPQEYWKALNDAGFAGFRLLIFSSGFTAEDPHADSAFRFDTRFRINMVHALVLADLLHVAECALRPYAVDRAQALAAIAEVEGDLLAAFRQRSYSRAVVRALRRASDRFAAIPRREAALPRIYITGEIFANLAHNEGNYNLRRFVMDQGCEVAPGLFTQRVMYDFWRQQHIFLPAIRYAGGLGALFHHVFAYLQSRFRRRFVLGVWNRYLRALSPERFGGRAALMDLDAMAEVGRDLYHPEIFGGEGNLEVAEARHYAGEVDGFISSKPFGCMPSSGVSDGVMAKVLAERPDLPFLAIETSGDNEVSILSRVSMLVFEAKQRVLRRRAEAALAPTPPDQLCPKRGAA